jgi:transcriptional antiterminator RfaH
MPTFVVDSAFCKEMDTHNKKIVNNDHPSEDLITNWYVIYTKPRHEKKVAEMLQSIGVEAYCPLKTQIKQWSDRKKEVDLPLFNSYIFVNIPEAKRASVFAVPGVVRYIYWCGKPAIVRNQEIEEIKRWLNDFDHQEIEVSYFKPDEKVRILSGSFINQEAKIVRQQGNHLVLTLEGLGLVLRTKLCETLLERV